MSRRVSVLCYLAAAGLNLAWLLRGDGLSVNVQLLVPILTVLIAGLGVLLRLHGLRNEERATYCRKVMWVLLFYYLAILAVLLFFGGLFHVDRVWGGAVNLEPFYTIQRFLIHYRRTGSLTSLFNLLGNVVIFVPLGALLPILLRPMRRVWLFLPCVAAICAGLEWLQWYTDLGIADVDDSILNIIGALLGWFIVRLCQGIYDWFKQARKNKGARR